MWRPPVRQASLLRPCRERNQSIPASILCEAGFPTTRNGERWYSLIALVKAVSATSGSVNSLDQSARSMRSSMLCASAHMFSVMAF